MHKGRQMPVVDVAARMKDVIRTINEKKFGMAIVVRDRDRVAGIITDGDLRRLVFKGDQILPRPRASSCMTADPLCISEEKMAVEALKIMEDRAVTSLIVVDDKNRLRGLLHLHDLWRTEMI